MAISSGLNINCGGDVAAERALWQLVEMPREARLDEYAQRGKRVLGMCPRNTFTFTTRHKPFDGSAFSWNNGYASTCRSGTERGLGRSGGRRPNSIESMVCAPSRSMPRIGALACLEVKMIGKPYALVGHVRFDEGGQDCCLRTTLNGHEAGNGGHSQG